MTLGRIKFQHLMMGLGLLLMASPLVDINTKGEVLHYHRVVYAWAASYYSNIRRTFHGSSHLPPLLCEILVDAFDILREPAKHTRRHRKTNQLCRVLYYIFLKKYTRDEGGYILIAFRVCFFL